MQHPRGNRGVVRQRGKRQRLHVQRGRIRCRSTPKSPSTHPSRRRSVESCRRNRKPSLIVGGGLAGAKAAEALRDNDFDGEVVLFATERAPALRASSAVEGIPGRQEEARRVHRRSPPPGTATTTSTCGSAPRCRRSTRTATSSDCPTRARCTTTSCCWPPVRRHDGRRSPAPTPTACTTCAPSTTPTPSTPP